MNQPTPESVASAPAPTRTFGQRYWRRLKIWLVILIGFPAIFTLVAGLFFNWPGLAEDNPMYSEAYGPASPVFKDWQIVLFIPIPLLLIFVVDMVQQLFRGNTQRPFTLATTEIALLMIGPLIFAFYTGLLPWKSADVRMAMDTEKRLAEIDKLVASYKIAHGKLPNFAASDKFYQLSSAEKDLFWNIPMNPRTRSSLVVVSEQDPASDAYGWYWSENEQEMYAVYMNREWIETHTGEPWSN